MGLSLNVGSLFSRTTRQRIGQRVLGGKPILLLGGNPFVNFGSTLQGFLIAEAISAIPALTWSLSELWAVFTEAALELYYFDWNQPDAELDRQAQLQWAAYGSILGGSVGNAIGYFACGVVPASSLMAIDEDLALYVRREISEEAFEEFAANAGNALRLATRNLTRQTMSWMYKGVRRWIKDPSNPIGEILFPGRIDEIREKWGAANGQSWTFAQAVDETIERIPSTFWQNFTEEVIDEAIDACIEAGYVLASSAEGFYARQRISRSFAGDRPRVVELEPDRSNEVEKIILAGPENQVRAQLPATIAHYQLIENRDIGQVIGSPVDDYLRQTPLSLRLKFQLYAFDSPPFYRDGQNLRVTITVPDVRRSALDWNKLRLAVGGDNGYLWGRFKARGRIDGKRYVTCYGATEDEAEDRLAAVMALSDAPLLTINTTEERRFGERLENPKLQKETTRVYPGHLTIMNRDRQVAIDQGRSGIEGNFQDRRYRFDLWRRTPPIDFDEKVAELLRFADVQ